MFFVHRFDVSSHFSSLFFRSFLILRLLFWALLLRERVRRFFVLKMSSKRISLLSRSLSIFYKLSHQMKFRFRIATQKKAQNEQSSSAKESSNDVERQRFNAFSSSLSFDVSKSNDQKNFDSFVDFSVLLIEQKATTLIRIWCEFCIRCVKSTALCVRVVSSINCQRCANQKNACVSINNEFHIFFILSLIDKMSWHHRKTTIIFIRENIRFREFEIRTVRSEVFLFLISSVKSWIKRYSVWKIYMIQLKRAHKRICVAHFAQQKLWIVENIRDVFWRWISFF